MTNIQGHSVLDALVSCLASQGNIMARKLRIDFGGENSLIEALFLMHGRAVVPSRSTENIRIERSWREANWVTNKYKNIFLRLEDQGLLNRSSDLDLFCLHKVFNPSIQRDLNELVNMRNHHQIRQSRRAREVHERHGTTFHAGRPINLYEGFESRGTPVVGLEESAASIAAQYPRPPPHAWEVDPLTLPEQAARQFLIDLLDAPGHDLVRDFLALRARSRQVLASGPPT